ncbi:MAG: C40 family peptidase [Actinobacteria bacterium]|nr:C40 family peptidase [Actinomycetota bacterium]
MDSTRVTPASSRSRVLRPIAVLAGLALVFAATMTSSASAQDVEGQRAKVQRLAAELSKLQDRAAALDEQYLNTQIALGKVQDQVRQNRDAVADAQARMDAARKQAGSYIVSAYMGAGTDLSSLGVSDPNTAVNEKVLLETLHGDRQQVADDLRAAQVDLDGRKADLDASSHQLASDQAQQKSLRSQLQSSVDQQQQLLSGANADLKAAIDAEQERQAQAAAAKAAAEEQARQQRAAADAAAAAARAATTASTAATRGPVATRPDRSTTTVGAPAPGSSPSTPAGPPAPFPVAPPSSGAGAAIAAAQSMLGTPYLWAGSSPSTGFDCSGLMMWAWARAGKSLPHSSSAQYAATQRISLDQLQPGDLVFFNNPISHVGMYIGGGMMIHSPHTGDVVKISPINRIGSVVRAGRVA